MRCHLLLKNLPTGLWQLLKETFGERIARSYVRTIDIRGQEGNCTQKCQALCHLPKRLIQRLLRQISPRYLNWRGQKEFAAKGIEMPDSMLLRAESRVVRFHHLRGPLRDAIIRWAIERDKPIKLRLQAGRGGAGKTRLLIEVCEKLENQNGWRAGFIDRSQSTTIGLPELLREGKPCLLVLDYAETRSSEIVELVRVAVHAKESPPLRLVLLARDGGDWWNHIADAAGKDDVIAAILQGFQTKAGPYRMEQERIQRKDRVAFFDDALNDFAAFRKKVAPAGAPDLSDDIFRGSTVHSFGGSSLLAG